MPGDAFSERLARVRQRFVSSLESKINDAYAAISELAGVTPSGTAVVGEVYRSIHGIVGVGPAVGFPLTGRAAREVEEVLRRPYQSRGGLTAEEIVQFKKRLYALREAATRELQFFYAV